MNFTKISKILISAKLSSFLSSLIFILLLVLNLNRLFKAHFTKINLSKLCTEYLNADTFLNSTDLFQNKLSLVSISIFPEALSGFYVLGSRCFGMVVTNHKLNEVFFVTNILIFYLFVFFLILSLVIFLSNDYKNSVSKYLKYIFILFTLLNLINFQINQLSFVFYSLIGICCFCMIFKATILNKSINKENFHIELKIFLISWVLLGVNEMRKLIFDDNDYYHFSLWLTNYSQGYNRRGLVGTVLTFLGNYIDPRILLVTVFFLLSIFISFFLYQIFTNKEQNLISLIVFLSPVFISFYSYDIKGSFRKEQIGLLAFVYLVSNLIMNKNVHIPLGIYYIAVFSHPANLFLFPAFGIILKKFGFNLKKIFLISLPLFLYIGGEFIFANNIDFSKSYFCNEMNLKRNIYIDCNNLDPQFAGAVNSSSSNYLNTTFNLINSTSLTYYILSISLGLLPFLYDRKFIKSNKLLLLYFISYLPLLALGYDWGRWIVLFLITISIFYFIEKIEHKISINNLFTFFIFILYVYFWKVDHCCNTNSLPFNLNFSIIESLNLVVLAKVIFTEIFDFIYSFII